MKSDQLEIKIRNILLKEDPMKIYFPEENNSDEYDNEVKIIIHFLPNINNENDLLNNIYELFMTRFGNLGLRTPKDKYRKIVNEIWELIKKDKFK